VTYLDIKLNPSSEEESAGVPIRENFFRKERKVFVIAKTLPSFYRNNEHKMSDKTSIRLLLQRHQGIIEYDLQIRVYNFQRDI